jgi:hypothetical protein
MILHCRASRAASIVSVTMGDCRTRGPGQATTVKHCDDQVIPCCCGPAVECLLRILDFVDNWRGIFLDTLGMKLRLGLSNFDAVSNQFLIVENPCPELRNCVREMFFDCGVEN